MIKLGFTAYQNGRKSVCMYGESRARTEKKRCKKMFIYRHIRGCKKKHLLVDIRNALKVYQFTRSSTRAYKQCKGSVTLESPMFVQRFTTTWLPLLRCTVWSKDPEDRL